MIRVNSKKAREKIQEYIRENYNPADYEEYVETDDLNLIAFNILHCFVGEKMVNDKRGLTAWDLFYEWCAGLPAILHTGFPSFCEGYPRRHPRGNTGRA